MVVALLGGEGVQVRRARKVDRHAGYVSACPAAVLVEHPVMELRLRAAEVERSVDVRHAHVDVHTRRAPKEVVARQLEVGARVVLGRARLEALHALVQVGLGRRAA